MIRYITIIVATCVLFPQFALANDRAPTSRRHAATGARAVFLAGLRAFEQANYAQALESFEEVQRLAPSPEVWFNIARCHEELGEPGRAVGYLHRYLQEHADAPDRIEVEARIARLAELVDGDAQVPEPPADGQLELRLDGTVAGPIHVRVDGRPATSEQLAGGLRLPSGVHELEVRAEGRERFRAAPEIYPGTRTRAYVSLPMPTPDEQSAGERTWTWVLAGGALLSAATAAGAHVLIGSRRADGRDTHRAVEVRDFALGTAVVATVAASVAYIIEPTLRQSRSRSVDLALVW